jgi:hypothetical protein
VHEHIVELAIDNQSHSSWDSGQDVSLSRIWSGHRTQQRVPDWTWWMTVWLAPNTGGRHSMSVHRAKKRIFVWSYRMLMLLIDFAGPERLSLSLDTGNKENQFP